MKLRLHFVDGIGGLLIGAALASCSVPRRAIPPDFDAAKLAPDMFRIRVDTQQVRVIEYQLKPFEKEPMHSHPAGIAVYFLTDGKFRVTYPDGRVAENDVTAGTALWRDPVTHTSENIGPAEVRAVLVELKKACE